MCMRTLTHHFHHLQILAPLNVRFEFGKANPTTTDDAEKARSACLISVFATVDIKAGEELLAAYGAAFWSDDVTDDHRGLMGI